jgi:hypothetical protein
VFRGPALSGGLWAKIASHPRRHKAPLATRLFPGRALKLAESQDGFDDAKHRLRGLLAQGAERTAFGRLSRRRSPRPESDSPAASGEAALALLRRWRAMVRIPRMLSTRSTGS